MPKPIVLNAPLFGRPGQSAKGWHTIGEKSYYFKSNWEVRYAKYLEFLRKGRVIIGWDYEPKTFWFESIKRGVRSYKPDFLVVERDGSFYWVEVKGYMDQKSRTKIKRFRKYYPDEELKVIGADWFKKQ